MKPRIFITGPFTAPREYFGITWPDGSESMFYCSISEAMKAIHNKKYTEEHRRLEIALLRA